MCGAMSNDFDERVRLLEGFLARPRIYRTERMQAAAEEAARANLRGEIAGLAVFP